MWLLLQHIVVPDTTEAASGKGAGECRTFHIKRFVTILIACEWHANHSLAVAAQTVLHSCWPEAARRQQ